MSGAARLRGGGRLHSLPAYHALHAAHLGRSSRRCCVLAAWAPMQTRLVDQAVLCNPRRPGAARLRDAARQRSWPKRGRSRTARSRAGFNPESTALAPAQCRRPRPRYGVIGGIAAILLALGAARPAAVRRRDREFRARTSVERWMKGLLIAS